MTGYAVKGSENDLEKTCIAKRIISSYTVQGIGSALEE
jgi:hypothetical protein